MTEMLKCPKCGLETIDTSIMKYHLCENKNMTLNEDWLKKKEQKYDVK